MRKEQDLPRRPKKNTLLPFLKPSTVFFYLWFWVIERWIFLSLSQEARVPCVFHTAAAFHKKSSVFYLIFPVAFKKSALDFATFIFSVPKAPVWAGGRKNINFTEAWGEVRGYVRNHTVTQNTCPPGHSHNQSEGWPFKQQEIFTHSGSLLGCVSKWPPARLRGGGNHFIFTNYANTTKRK